MITTGASIAVVAFPLLGQSVGFADGRIQVDGQGLLDGADHARTMASFLFFDPSHFSNASTSRVPLLTVITKTFALPHLTLLLFLRSTS